LIRRRILEHHFTFYFRWCSAFILILAYTSDLTAQTNLACQKFLVSDTIKLSDNVVSDISFLNNEITIDWELIDGNKILIKNLKNIPKKSVEICYREISSVLTRPIYKYPIEDYNSKQIEPSRNFSSLAIEKEELFQTPGLYKSGTISRGITVGNRQNLFVNSSLNLQLSGQLSDDLFINAVITDQNIPYQPSGNTQQIRDFDNVYMQLYNDKFEITAGDIVLQNSEYGHFLKYYKNQLGFQLKYRDAFSNGAKSTSKASAAFHKGKFASTVVTPIEGVSGPYRLRGAQNERFIIVIANSERVYIDGQLLTRGFDNDYIIDYNLGEVTFNPNVVITRFTRIRIDFEYTIQSFSRSILFGSQLIETDRASFYADYYREKDNPNSSLNVDLSLEDRQYLSSIGDQTNQAFISGIDSTSFSESEILYAEIDTVVNGVSYTIFKRSVNQQETLYRLSFTELGFGNGDYILKGSSSNGREYEWVAPINGISQGSFTPGIKIEPPNMRQMLVFGSEIKLSDNESVFQELAASNHDQNLFSSLDDGDNNGVAILAGFRSKERDITFLSDYKIDNEVSFEWNDKYFRPIDRFRSIEFDRDWNNTSTQDSVFHFERIIGYSTSIYNKKRSTYTNYRLGFRERGDVLNGTQHWLDMNERISSFRYRGNHFFQNTKQRNVDTRWLRSFSDLSIDLHPVKVGGFYNLDQNIVSDANNTNNILSTAMYYDDYGGYIANSDSANFSLKAKVGYRKDKLPISGELDDFTRSEYTNLNFSTSSIKDQFFDVFVEYRGIDDQVNIDKSRNIIQGRVISDNRFFKNSIRNNLNYATANSRELKREFVFTQVGAGQGTHTWRDENEDGIQDLNEFYEAINADERNYIKVFVPTDEYIEAFQVQYNHTLELKAPQNWKNSKGLLKGISKFAFLVNWNLDRKTTSDSPNDRVNPYVKVDDEDLIFERSLKRYNLFYNRLGRGIGLDLSYLDRFSKQLNQNGFEELQTSKYGIKTRWNFSSQYQVNLEYSNQNRNNISDFLNSRNFDLFENLVSPEIVWQPTQKVRFGLQYRFENKNNQFTSESTEYSTINEWKTKFTWSSSKSGMVNSEISFLDIGFEGDVSTYLGYILLEGLQPGNNLRVNLNWQQSLRNGLQLTFQYFGRKSSKREMIHSGTVQLTAFF